MDPLAIALVVAANFAFERIRPKTRENLYGETVECSVPEGREFNTPYDIDDLIPDTPYTKEEVSEVLKNESKKEQIKKLEEEAVKMENRPFYKNAYNVVKDKIKKLKDEDNIITY
jgi:hypothetical protein